MSQRPRYEGEPTLARVMLRPQWILALLLALGVAAGFASLAQWQMGSAVKLEESAIDSETVYPLDELTSVNTPVTTEVAGRMVTAELALVPGDSYIVGERMNQGRKGFWVVSHFTNAEADEHIAVALGWAASFSEARTALMVIEADGSLASPHEVIGRYMPSEGVSQPTEGEALDTFDTLATGQAINLWDPWRGSAYAGYLVSASAPAGLEVIDSYPPLPEEKINWLNLFYAIEWIVFAGFAVFFWYRLTRDAWEKEHERRALLAQSSAGPGVE